MRAGTLRTDTLKASARVDASGAAATIVLLAQALVHIWKTKQWSVTDKRAERPPGRPPRSLVTTGTTTGCCHPSVYYLKSFFPLSLVSHERVATHISRLLGKR